MEWIIEGESLEDVTEGRFTIGREVVRCKDCKGYNAERLACVNDYGTWQPDDFCSYGERSEDETD